MKKELFLTHSSKQSKDQTMSELENKLNILRDRWVKRNDSTGKRLMFKILQQARVSESLMKLIVEDDFAAFDKAYQLKPDSNSKLADYFEAACICGSRNIVDQFIKEYKFDILLSDDAIAYALSTGDFNFAKSLADIAISSGQTSPGNIHSYNACSFSELGQIKNLFTSVSKKQTADL